MTQEPGWHRVLAVSFCALTVPGESPRLVLVLELQLPRRLDSEARDL